MIDLKHESLSQCGCPVRARGLITGKGPSSCFQARLLDNEEEGESAASEMDGVI